MEYEILGMILHRNNRVIYQGLRCLLRSFARTALFTRYAALHSATLAHSVHGLAYSVHALVHSVRGLAHSLCLFLRGTVLREKE